MSRIKAAYKLAESHAKELGYAGILDAIFNGTLEHKAAVRAKSDSHLKKTMPTSFRMRQVKLR
ncbi:hypothetical protein OTK49_20915 [Vibrio coralliirubri]|uniref:hypothetical protein n=1 Tax=Vibrio coralliirubri TaxID=1516159 RepID=UPI002283EB09|nr:hypothetical protein [Vibrio coralliirubri]MCY9864981.1 hypothetical protein [Vibrio coralliirubri]